MESSFELLKSEAEFRKQIIGGPLRYTLGLSLSSDTFSGYVIIDFITRRASDNLWIDYAGDSIRIMRINTTQLKPIRKGNKLYLGTLKPGTHKLHIEFSSSYSTNGTGLHKFVDPYDDNLYIYSYMCPYYANKVFPCFDQPDLKGTFSISIDARSEYFVISNEEIESQETLDLEFKRVIFKPTPPMSTYILAILCGNYEGDDDIFSRSSISCFIRRKEIREWLVAGNELYSNFFGIDMPFSKCSQVFCPEFNMGAMENAGCVTINDSHVWKEKPVKSEYNWLQNTILHELCHMWFGNYVTLRWWDDLWLNESFATYFSYFVSSKSVNPEAWAGFFVNKVKAYSMDCLSSTHPVHVEVADTQEAISNLDYITYWKGASLLKNLAFIIGEEAFSQGLKRYFSSFSWMNVELTDFVDSMQSPLLKKWISEWVETKGLNSLELVVNIKGTQIAQCQAHQGIVSGNIFRTHCLLIEGVNEEGTVFKEKVTISPQETTDLSEFIGKNNVKGLIVNSEDHGYIQVILDPMSMEFFFQAGNIKTLSTLNRALAWQSLWNRVEDLKMKGSEFIKYISQLLEYEEDEHIIDLISGYSHTILSDYCPLNLLPEYSHMLFESIMLKLQSTPENKCLQRKIFTVAYTDNDIIKAFEYSLNLGRSEKWKGIMLYSTILPYDTIKDMLGEELKYDRNDMSILLTNYCESAAYDNKSKIWEEIVNKSGQSMMQVEYLMKAFWQTKNLEYLSEYYQKYFDVLPSIVANFDREYAENFLKLMLPRDDDLDRLIMSLKGVDIPHIWVMRFVEDTIAMLEKNKKHLLNFA